MWMWDGFWKRLDIAASGMEVAYKSSGSGGDHFATNNDIIVAESGFRVFINTQMEARSDMRAEDQSIIVSRRSVRPLRQL